MTTSNLENDATETLASAVRLLFRAADQARAEADAEGPLCQRPLFALGVNIAACQGSNLLPDDVDLEQDTEPTETSPEQLLRAAEKLLATIPIEAFPDGTSQLIVSVCDLIRETVP